MVGDDTKEQVRLWSTTPRTPRTGAPSAPTPEGEAAEATGLDAPTLLRGQRRSSRGTVPGGPRRLDPGQAERPGRPRGVVPSEIGPPPRRSTLSREIRQEKMCHGFFLARWGEVLGSRKKLQGKDLQKQKRCGLLECSYEDVRNYLAGGKQ